MVNGKEILADGFDLQSDSELIIRLGANGGQLSPETFRFPLTIDPMDSVSGFRVD